jgi:hypothetical protein
VNVSVVVAAPAVAAPKTVASSATSDNLMNTNLVFIGLFSQKRSGKFGMQNPLPQPCGGGQNGFQPIFSRF